MEEKTDKKVFWIDENFHHSYYLTKKLWLEKGFNLVNFDRSKKYKNLTAYAFEDTPELRAAIEPCEKEIDDALTKKAKYRAEHSKEDTSTDKKDV